MNVRYKFEDLFQNDLMCDVIQVKGKVPNKYQKGINLLKNKLFFITYYNNYKRQKIIKI